MERAVDGHCRAAKERCPRPPSHLSVPTASAPVLRSPQEIGPHERGRHGRPQRSPFPPTDNPPHAARGLPHFGRGVRGRYGTEKPNPPTLTQPLPPPSPLTAVWSRPPSTNHSTPPTEEVSFTYPHEDHRLRRFYWWKSTPGHSRCPIRTQVARDAWQSGAGLHCRGPIGALVGWASYALCVCECVCVEGGVRGRARAA